MRQVIYRSLQRKLVYGLSSTTKLLHLHLRFRMALKLAKQFRTSTSMSSPGRREILKIMMKYMTLM
ncbi:unnamed protein product [Triticum turgidum subsp. durum]|uniref:Uncharacterized protein n=1 Tax=Triticum turgidum subsp. durum TaxID=4567 RepID=A0A9R0TLV6_TRITD|nr:unnamed protein product [Triticum turgidum subsp. durum]